MARYQLFEGGTRASADRPDLMRELEDLMWVNSIHTDYSGKWVIEGIVRPSPREMTAAELRVNLFTIYQEIIRRVEAHGGRLAGEPGFLIGEVKGRVRASVKITLWRDSRG